MMKIKTAILALVLLNLTSCIKILNDDLASKPTKLVLNAAISPDSALTVNLSRTFNVFEDESNKNLPFVDDAQIGVFENGNHLFDLQNLGYGYYIKDDFYPAVGETYSIEASFESYKKIQSSTMIPAKVPIVSFDTLSIEVEDEYTGKETHYIGKLNYSDPGGTGNQYQLSCRVWYKDENGNEIWYDQAIWVAESETMLFDNSYGSLLWSDKYTDGKDVEIRFVFYNTYKYNKSLPAETEFIRFTFFFQSINHDYYTYLKSLNMYYESGGSEDPFSEPVVIFSNIENGYGIFGSYNTDTATAKIAFEDSRKGGDK